MQNVVSSPSSQPRYEVGVLSKALDIIDMLRNTAEGATLTDISAALKLPKPTVFRIVRTLESRAYLERTDAGRYRLSSKLRSASDESGMEHLLTAAQPIMRRLVDAHRETVNLALLDGGEIVVVQAFESPESLRMSSKVGNRRHIHSTALGKALIAWMNPDEALRLLRLKGLPRFMPRTLTSEKAVMKELGRVRKLGYAEDREENEPGGRCVAVPVRDAGGRVIAALSVSGPINRMRDRKIAAILRDLIPAGKELSQCL
jgi:DNA-binding IclR family transcriptional regulator